LIKPKESLYFREGRMSNTKNRVIKCIGIIILDSSVQDDIIREWIDHSYELVVQGLRRTDREVLNSFVLSLTVLKCKLLVYRHITPIKIFYSTTFSSNTAGGIFYPGFSGSGYFHQ